MKASWQPIDISGRGLLELRHLVLDLNGTVALDGGLLPGVTERVAALGDCMSITLPCTDRPGQCSPPTRAALAQSPPAHSAFNCTG